MRDVTVLATDAAHADAITAACEELPDVEVENVSDRTFLLHLGGKIHTDANAPVKTRDDLSMAYTPGVVPGLPWTPNGPSFGASWSCDAFGSATRRG